MAEATRATSKMDLDRETDAKDAAGRRASLYAWNVWDPASSFYGTALARACREPDPTVAALQEVWEVLYAEIT